LRGELQRLWTPSTPITATTPTISSPHYDSITFTYDKNSNLTRKTQNSTDITTYTFDYENEITRIYYPDETYSEYKDDALARRIEKRDKDGNISRYVYDDRNFIAEYDGSNDLVVSYLQGLRINSPISMYRDGESYWYHTDALGSVYAMTDSTEAVSRRYDYSAFGKIIAESGSLANPFTYTARKNDQESGLYCYRARYYDAEVGRFLSPLALHTSLSPVPPHQRNLRIKKKLYSFHSNPIRTIRDCKFV
jgi:RHS repeat-associated protein